MNKKTNGEWHFQILDDSCASGRGGIKGKFTLDQIAIVDVRAVFEQDDEVKYSTVLPSVPWFLVSAFDYLQREGVGLPDTGDSDETFRKSGSFSRQTEFWSANQKALANRSSFSFQLLTEIDVGALIKRFLRELKTPLIGSHSRLLSELLEEMRKEPQTLEFDGGLNPLAGTLLFVLFNLHSLANRGSSRMTTDSLGIILAPSIIRPDRSKDKQKELNTNESAVSLLQYMIRNAPNLHLLDCISASRGFSVPPHDTRRLTGTGSRSVVKRMFRFVRSKSQEREGPLVRAVCSPSTPLSSRRKSHALFPPPASLASRKSRSSSRRLPCWSPFLLMDCTPVKSLSSSNASTPRTRVTASTEGVSEMNASTRCNYSESSINQRSSERLCSNNYEPASSNYMKDHDDVLAETDQNPFAKKTENLTILQEHINSIYLEASYPYATMEKVANTDIHTMKCSNLSDCSLPFPTLSTGFNDQCNITACGQNAKDEENKTQEHNVEGSDDFVSLAQQCKNSAGLSTVVLRSEHPIRTSRPSLVQLRKNQTVQKKRAVFENAQTVQSQVRSQNDFARLSQHSRRHSVATTNYSQRVQKENDLNFSTAVDPEIIY